jgi:hypothetical protein
MQMEQKSWVKPILALVILVAAVGAAFALVFSAYQEEGANRSAWLSAGADPDQTADRMDVLATVQSVDPIKGEAVVRLDFFPKGTLASADGWSATRDFTVYTNSSLKPSIAYKKGQRINAVDVTFELYNGLYTDYPFDRHDSEIQIYIGSMGQPKSEGEQPQEEMLPVSVELFGMVHGFSLQGVVAAESAPDFADINLTIARSSSTIVWAVFVMALLWLMTLGVVGVTFYVVLFNRKLEFGSFAWMGAMLFAFVSFRSAAPGVPPIGSLIDFVAFFWAEFLVAASLIVMVTVYLIRPQK